MINHLPLYASLEVAPDADAAAIQSAYERLSALYDPAQFQSAAPELRARAAERYAEISRAFATLSDPVARAAYDQQHTTKAAVHAAEADWDYRPLSAPGVASSPDTYQARFSWVSVKMISLISVLATLAGTTFMVWLGTRPPVPQTADAPMPLFASMIAAEIPDQGVRDQLFALDATVAQAESLIARDSRNPVAWVMLGNAHYDFIQTIYEQAPAGQAYALNLERWQQASEAYTQALQLEPLQPVVRSDLALALIRYGLGLQNPGYVEQGVAEAERALREDNQTPQVLLNVGRALALAEPDRQEQARDLWQQVLATNPDTLLAAQAQALLQGSQP